MKIKYSILAGLFFALIMFTYLAFTTKMSIAIVVSIFIVLVSPFLFYIKLFSKMELGPAFQKISKEDVLYSGMANHDYDRINVGGTLYLFPEKLIFQTNWLNFMKRHELIIPITAIQKVEFCKTLQLIDNGLLLTLEDNHHEEFVVYNRETWKQEIEKQRIQSDANVSL